MPNWKDELWSMAKKVRQEGGRVELAKYELNKNEFRMAVIYYPPKIHRDCDIENKYIIED